MVENIMTPFRGAFGDCVWKPLLHCLPSSPVLSTILGAALLLGLSWLWWKSLVWLYSGPDIAPVVQPVRKPVALSGAILGILSMFQLFRYEQLSKAADIVFIAVSVMVLLWGLVRACLLRCPVLKKMFVFVVFLVFVFQAFLIGMVAASASMLILVFAIAAAFVMGMAGKSFGGSSEAGSDDYAVPKPDRKELEDGTVIEKSFGCWEDINDRSKHYKEDLFGGTFSRTD